MAAIDPKRTATTILAARGTAEYDDLIESTFASLPKTAAGRELAWKILELADERASETIVLLGGKGSSDREIRVLGRVVAWRDTKGRSVSGPGKVTFEIGASAATTKKRIDELLAKKFKDPVWGTRPAADELPDLEAHARERAKILKAGDVAKLKAYRDRYRAAVIITTTTTRGWPRQYASKVWDPGDVLVDAAASTNDPKVIDVLLAETSDEDAVRSAVETALEAKHLKLLPRLVPLLSAKARESFGDALRAVRGSPAKKPAKRAPAPARRRAT